MSRMSKFLSFLGGGGLAMALMATGCSRPIAVPGDGVAAQPDPHQAPFHEDGAKLVNARKETAIPDGKASENHLPFHDHDSLPAGTLISVRLKTSISVEDPEPSDAFDAVVVEPVVIEGDTLIPTGILVSGRIEAALTSKVKRNRGYVRLKLASAHIGGQDVPLQTASLFARQAPLSDGSSPIVRVEKGRRLTFALAEPAYIAGQPAPAPH